MNEEERQQYIDDHAESEHGDSEEEEHEWVDWKRQDDVERVRDTRFEQRKPFWA
jgi:hypothetical protein